MRALAEAPRLLLHYTETEYDYVMSWDYYDNEWSEVKSKVPFRPVSYTHLTLPTICSV